MRRNLKKALSLALALLFALGSVPAIADDDPEPTTNDEFFPDIIIKDLDQKPIRYYDMLGNKTKSAFMSGMDEFAKEYLTTPTTQIINGETKEYSSVMERWGNLAEEIVNGVDLFGPEAQDNELFWVKFDGNFGTAGPISNFGVSSSIYNAIHTMGDKIDKATDTSTESYHLYPDEYSTDTKNNLCVYYYKAFPVHYPSTMYDGYGIVFSDFMFAHVINGEYITKNIMEQEDYVLEEEEPDIMYAQHFMNETAQSAQATAQVSTKITDTLTLKQSHSQSHSESKSRHVDADFNVSGKGLFLKKFADALNPVSQGELGGGVTFKVGGSWTWSDTFQEYFETGKTEAKETANSSTISTLLPPYTEAYIMQGKGNGRLKMEKFDMPVILVYNVTIVYYKRGESYTYDGQLIGSKRLNYIASADRNSTDGRDDLHQRMFVRTGVADPEGVNNSYDDLRAAAKSIWEDVPLSKADTGISYSCTYTMSRLTDIRPLQNLTRVQLADKRTHMALKVGEPIDVSTIRVEGVNKFNVPYFGFDDSLGSWKLVDVDNNLLPESGNGYANEYLKLEKDSLTGKLALTALQPGGTAVLKYEIPDKTYINIEETPIGATEERIVYTENGDIDNQATLIIRTTQDMTGYSVTAEGEISGHVGDEDVDLNGEDSPVSGWLEDASGAWIPDTVHWKVRYPGRNNITISEDDKLTFVAAGENEIRAEWGTLHSEWLPVTVKEQQRLAALELSDPNDVLASWRMSTEGNTKTYDLDLLSLQCKNQYGETMEKPANLKWFVEKDGMETEVTDPHAFSVTESGEYSLCAKSGEIVSNALSLSVSEAPRLDEITLSDDRYHPVLTEIILGDGQDTLDLTRLKAEGIDQYGDPFAFSLSGMEWLVNGELIEGSNLTVTQPGTYLICCRNPDWTNKASNELELTVKPARAPEAPTIADNEYNPLLADYILDDGENTFDLTKLTVTANDQYGRDWPVDMSKVTWLVNGSAIEGSGLMVVEAGTYKIACRLEGQSVKSNDLILTVLAARAPGAPTIADNEYTPLLADYILDDGENAFDLSKLSVTAVDQYGQDWPVDLSKVTWLVDGSELSESMLTVTEAGTYKIACRLEGQNAKSNDLMLKVLAARAPGAPTLSDNEYNPLLADYILDDGENTFDLSKLTVTAIDQYGQDWPVDMSKVTWLVNGSVIEGSELTVAEAGTYMIACRLEGQSARSNALTLTVMPARQLKSLSISDDAIPPLLADYRMGSGTDEFDLSGLSVTAMDQYGSPLSGVNVTWYVNGAELDGSVLRINVAGSYQIAARAAKGGAPIRSNALTLNVVSRISEVRLDYDAYTMSKLEKVQLNAVSLPAGEPDTYTYKTSNANIISVDENGIMTARQTGTATVTVISASNPDASAQCVVTVVNPPESIALLPGEILLTVNGTRQLNTKISPEGTPTTLVYSSDDERIATVDTDGRVTGIKTGSTLIHAETHNGLSGICYVKVVPETEGLDVPDELLLGVGETYPLGENVVLRTRSLALITYESIDPETVTVDRDGLVTALTCGETAIIITAPGNITKEIPVTVVRGPESIQITPDKTEMAAGDRQKLEVTLLPVGSSGKLTFVSSDPLVAEVAEDGTVTALSQGEAMITVAAYNGLTATCAITNKGVTPDSHALRLPAALKIIGTGAFAGNPARIVFLSDGATVETGAFAGCTNLLIVVTKDASGIREGAFDHEVKIVEELN